MIFIKKVTLGIVLLLLVVGCANKGYLSREYDESLTLNITASEVISKLSKDFNVEIENVTETCTKTIQPSKISNAENSNSNSLNAGNGSGVPKTKTLRIKKIKNKVFIFKHKQLRDYMVLVFAKDENAKVNLIEISNYMNFAPTNMTAEDRDNHYLSSSQLARLKKDFSFLPCSNNKDFLKTDNLCENNYVVSDDSYDSGGFISLILIEPVKK